MLKVRLYREREGTSVYGFLFFFSSSCVERLFSSRGFDCLSGWRCRSNSFCWNESRTGRALTLNHRFLSLENLSPMIFLQSLLTDEQVANAPIVVLGNKIDLPGAVSEQELRYVLGISSTTTGKVSERCCFCSRRPLIPFLRALFPGQVSMAVRWNYSCAVSWDAKGMVKHFDGYRSICRDMICWNVSSIFIRLSSWFRPHLCVLVSCFFLFFCLIAEEIFILDKSGIISVKDKHSFCFLLSSFSLSTNGCVVFYIKQKQRDFLKLIDQKTFVQLLSLLVLLIVHVDEKRPALMNRERFVYWSSEAQINSQW